ncbi:MAG TPA: quinone oxidoreductase [Stellaceae bacterium]|nr:quinone oxidoreductase [Stellaceae bacterium]
MTQMARIHSVGGPEMLVAEDVDLPSPGTGEVLIRQTAIGVNFVDIYHRLGLYPLPALPVALGVEGAGGVEAIGPGVDTVAVGDRVAYAGLPVGGYAAARLIPADRLIRLPDTITETTAAAVMLRGLTAEMLMTKGRGIAAGDTVLIHAAAGGLGLILAQWAKSLGATVIGTVGTTAKAALARDYGTDHAILYREADFVAAVRDLTGGRGVDMAIDGIGGTTLGRTLDCVRPGGTVATIGRASGPVAEPDLAAAAARRSVDLTRPSVIAYIGDGTAYRIAAEALFAKLAEGLRVRIGETFPLADAARAHRAMEAGTTTGSPLLIP